MSVRVDLPCAFFTTKEIGTGTGLGLSTAIGIVKSYHKFNQRGGLWEHLRGSEIDALPEGALALSARDQGRLIVTRNDAEEIAFVHLATNWYYAPTSWHWRGGTALEFRVQKPLPESQWALVRVA